MHECALGKVLADKLFSSHLTYDSLARMSSGRAPLAKDSFGGGTVSVGVKDEQALNRILAFIACERYK